MGVCVFVCGRADMGHVCVCVCVCVCVHVVACGRMRVLTAVDAELRNLLIND